MGTERSELRWAGAGVEEISGELMDLELSVDGLALWPPLTLCWMEEVRVGGVGGEGVSFSKEAFSGCYQLAAWKLAARRQGQMEPAVSEADVLEWKGRW